MKISTGGISSNYSPNPTLAPPYDYTWAWDASKQTNVLVVGGGLSQTFESDGIRLTRSAGSTTTSLMIIVNDIVGVSARPTPGSHSNPSDETNVIPEGAVPIRPYTSSGISPLQAAEGHGGRYLSCVFTINSHTHITPADASGLQMYFVVKEQASVGDYENNMMLTKGGLSHHNGNLLPDVNGAERTISSTTWGDLSTTYIDANMVGKGPQILTFDTAGKADQTPHLAEDHVGDPSRLQWYIHYSGTATDIGINMVLHGMVFSATPPKQVSLPIHINRPTIIAGR